MKIYTKTGDSGHTQLIGGFRVQKDDQRLQTIGAIDELNSVLGLALSEAISSSTGSFSAQESWVRNLIRIQGELFQLGAELAQPRNSKTSSETKPTHRFGAPQVEMLEQEIDHMDGQLAKLSNFILPGGSKAAAALHLARTVCRRAERELISLHQGEPIDAEILKYINRLSDYLFIAARWINQLLQVADVIWTND